MVFINIDSWTALGYYSAIYNLSVRDLNWKLLWHSGMNVKYVTAVPLSYPVPQFDSFSASEMTYIVSSGALNSTHSLFDSFISWKAPEDRCYYRGEIFSLPFTK